MDFDRAGERLGTYAFLKTAEDTANSNYQRMHGRYINIAGRAAQAASYHPAGDHGHSGGHDEAVSGPPSLAPYRLLLERLLRYKPHTLGKKEEKLLAMQSEMAQAAGQVFRQLNDADLKFGTIKNDTRRAGRAEPRLASAPCCTRPSEASARRRFISIIASMPAHQNTLAATLAGSVQRDVYYARARNYPSAWRRRCFPTTCRRRSTTT